EPPAPASPAAVSQGSWQVVPLGGGGYVTGITAHPRTGEIYIRSDCGGALRWNEARGEWDSITDKIVPVNSREAEGLFGVSGIALDPTDPKVIYVAAGSFSWSPGGIFASSDHGATWTRLTSIMVEGNGPSVRATHL
ncbi:MAG: carbohydrate-binding protein, partial [candidate division NC10 bacterium]